MIKHSFFLFSFYTYIYIYGISEYFFGGRMEKKKKCEREQSKSVNKRIKFPNNF